MDKQDKVNFKYTFTGQMLAVMLAHLEMAALYFIVWLLAIGLIETNTFGLIFYIFTTASYFASLYFLGYKLCKDDKKSYTSQEPIWYKGIILPIVTVVLNLLVVLGYILAWSLGAKDGGLIKPWSVLLNAFDLFWFSPFVRFMCAKQGVMAVSGWLIAVIFPTLPCFLGYFAGYKDFDVTTKLGFLVYEKKKKK